MQKKLKGNSSDLEGYIFVCSDSRQANKYLTAFKRITEYVGAEFKYGGNIRRSIENSKHFETPMPTAPIDNDTALLKMILNRKIDIYVKRDGIIDENLQKAHPLIHGQCTELLKSNLKTSANWETVSYQYDMLGLLGAIKTIIYKFEDQKYLPLSLHHAKTNFYALRQGNLPNTDYLDRFMNLVDMSESYDAKLYYQAMFKIAQDFTVYSTTAEADLQDNEIEMIETTAQEIYLACVFVINSDLRQYVRLIEDLENDYTKGNDNYPRNMVKAYQFLNEYKQCNPRATLPDSLVVEFSQQGNNNKSVQRTIEWKKKSTCHNCGQTEHIRPECLAPMTENDDDKKK